MRHGGAETWQYRYQADPRPAHEAPYRRSAHKDSSPDRLNAGSHALTPALAAPVDDETARLAAIQDPLEAVRRVTAFSGAIDDAFAEIAEARWKAVRILHRTTRLQRIADARGLSKARLAQLTQEARRRGLKVLWRARSIHPRKRHRPPASLFGSPAQQPADEYGPSMDLEAMLSSAATSGWSSGVGTLAAVTAEAARLKLEPLANRRGESTVSHLRPTTEEEAKPRSLSAQVGLGAQPLHTDGAHQERPPDFLVFVSERPSSTPTWLRQVQGRDVPWHNLRNGMFLVGTGPAAFFAPAVVGLGPSRRFRFDPGCMTPCDARARAATEFLADTTDATRFDWTTPSQILVVDNKMTLHGRGQVDDDDLDRELVRIAFRKLKP